MSLDVMDTAVLCTLNIIVSTIVDLTLIQKRMIECSYNNINKSGSQVDMSTVIDFM